MFESPHLFSEIRILRYTKVLHSYIMSFLVPELNSKMLCLFRRMKEGGEKKKEKDGEGKKRKKEEGGKKKKKKEGRGKKKRIEGGNEKKKKKETVEWDGDGGLDDCGGF